MNDKPECVRKVEELKLSIRKSVRDAVLAFEADTGMTPSEIRVDIIEATKFGDIVCRYDVGDVRVRLGEW